MVRLGPAPQQPDRPRPARSGRRRVPPQATRAPSRRPWPSSWSPEHPDRRSRPSASCRARPRASCSGRTRCMDALGAGSMGTVYKAQSKTDNKLVRRQGAAAAEHVERPPRPPQGPRVRAVQAPGRRAVRRRRHRRRHALPRLAARRRRDARKVACRRRASCRAGMAAQYALQIAAGPRRLPSAGPVPRPAQAVEPDGRRRRHRSTSSTSASARLLAENEGESLVDTMSTANTRDQRPGLRQPREHHGADQPHAGGRPVQPRLRASTTA